MDTWLVSAPLADVLRRYDMGRTSFYPVKAFQIDRRGRGLREAKLTGCLGLRRCRVLQHTLS